jgi:secondary thiamine-phosphate synthase enzyme
VGVRKKVAASRNLALARLCGASLDYTENMAHFSRVFSLPTREKHEVFDITPQVNGILHESGVQEGQLTVYTPHATAAIAINENDDPNIGIDFLAALSKMVIEHAGWLHDRVDNNAAAHIKSALVGPSETIPIIGGKLCLGTWQNVFFVEFDGPRRERRIVVSIVS